MGKTILPYYERSKVPWCVLGKVSWGVVQAVRVPEAIAHQYTGKHGWTVLIRDSDFPVPCDDAGTMPEVTSTQASIVRRHHRYRSDAHYWREDDGA